MKKQILAALFILASIVFSNVTFAQSEWNWCAPADKTKEKYKLFASYARVGDYESAKKPLDELLESCPKLHIALYQNGVNVYKKLANATRPRDKNLMQKRLDLYYKRIELFGVDHLVLNEMASFAYSLHKRDNSQYSNLLKLFDQTFELSGNRVFQGNLESYMEVVRRYKMSGNEISDTEILERYTIITDIIDFQMKKVASSDSAKQRLSRILEKVNESFKYAIDKS